MKKQTLVIKLGSALLSKQDGSTNSSVIRKIADEIASVSSSYRIILVSSGAVSSGKQFLKQYKGTLTERKAAAAIGNPILIELYRKQFARHGITVAQALCERHHFSNRNLFVQLKNTFEAFWKNGVLPIVNENDLISNNELKFSDNDELATLLAIGFNAQKMILCTSSNGLLNKEGKIVSVVPSINTEIYSYVTKEKSSVGLGGMLSKITFTRLATSLGIEVYMSGLIGGSPIQKTLKGLQGTCFKAHRSTLKDRQKWLLSGSVTVGQIHVDEGAEKALTARKSLLTVGIKRTEGTFNSGEVVQLMNTMNMIIGVAKTRMSSKEIHALRSSKNQMAAHANDIVLF
ncbi:MAG: glutamate 5-kinase [Bacteroidota bacterium]